MAGKELYNGRCSCGKVSFETTAAPDWIGICHCDTCRRATGGVLGGACGFPRDAVTINGKTHQHYQATAEVRRSFCSNCGSSISYQSSRWPTDIHIMIGVFDEPENLTPQFHLFIKDRLPWICLADTLVQYNTTPGNSTAERQETSHES